MPLGEPIHDDDSFDAKVEVLLAERPAVVSFAFAWPPSDVVDRLRSAGMEVWVTLNEASETAWADALGVEVVEIAAAGHLAALEDPEAVAGALAALHREASE